MKMMATECFFLYMYLKIFMITLHKHIFNCSFIILMFFFFFNLISEAVHNSNNHALPLQRNFWNGKIYLFCPLLHKHTSVPSKQLITAQSSNLLQSCITYIKVCSFLRTYISKLLENSVKTFLKSFFNIVVKRRQEEPTLNIRLRNS